MRRTARGERCTANVQSLHERNQPIYAAAKEREVAMNEDDDYTPKLDADLVTTLTRIFALGYIDRMAGFQVKDDDLIVGVDASEIERLALDCIAQGEDMIHANYIENPQMCHDAMYATGKWAYSECERQYLQRN